MDGLALAAGVRGHPRLEPCVAVARDRTLADPEGDVGAISQRSASGRKQLWRLPPTGDRLVGWRAVAKTG